jgi:penicillin-binding protein 1C
MLWHWLSRRKRRFFKVVVGLALLGLLVRSLPYLTPIHPVDLAQDDQAIEFRDRNGLPLGTLLTRDQDHTAVVGLDQLSPSFIQAILAAEDSRFYQHGAVEMRAIARAILEALQARRVVSGASTITMQLARLIEPTPRTLVGKLQEIWMAWRLAAGMSKDEILQAYVNRLPMGGNIYGVEAAARVYFGVPASDLTVSQASLLAALPNDPNRLNPYNHWQALKQRQTYVLDRMVQDGYLTREQANLAYQETVSLQPRQQGIVAAPHFLFWLADQLPPDHPSQIRTTLDRPLQEFVEAQVRQILAALAPNHVQQAAALVIDNHTGEVLAYVGSVDYFSQGQQGRNDGVQALRQPGSTLKPFVYELALEQHVIRPSTVLADVPTYYPIPGAQLYSPVDYNERFQGPVRVRVALANSLNIPAIRVLEKVGVAAFLNRLQELGFAHLNQSPEYYGLGLVLGSGEVSLWELARAYVTLAGQGEPIEIKAWRGQGDENRADSRDDVGHGNAAPTSKAIPLFNRASLSPSAATTWALIIDMLSDRHARATSFGVDSVLSLPFPAAVKTGTSSDFRDTWTIGFTTDYTVATWVGNFNGEPMRQVSGVTGAAPLWQRLMLHLHEQREPKPFPPPKDLVKRPICALSGMKPSPACLAVVEEYFYPQDLHEYERQVDTFFEQVANEQGESQYRLNLPEEYDEWLAMQSQPVLVPSTLKIISPRHGDYFLMAPMPTTEHNMAQRLEFKLATPPDRPVEWWLNGQKLETNASTSYFWPLQPGTWTLKVKNNDDTDQVRFEVGVAEEKPARRGFSINPGEF